jgi:hypothetical protein
MKRVVKKRCGEVRRGFESFVFSIARWTSTNIARMTFSCCCLEVLEGLASFQHDIRKCFFEIYFSTVLPTQGLAANARPRYSYINCTSCYLKYATSQDQLAQNSPSQYSSIIGVLRKPRRGHGENGPSPIIFRIILRFFCFLILASNLILYSPSAHFPYTYEIKNGRSHERYLPPRRPGVSSRNMVQRRRSPENLHLPHVRCLNVSNKRI